MSYTPFQAPILAELLGDAAIAEHFSIRAELAAMLRFEAALALAQARNGVIADEAAGAIARACLAFQPDMAAIAAATRIDGVVVPELVRQLRRHVGGEFAAGVHFAATSQDVIDTAFVLRLVEITAIMRQRLLALGEALAALAAKFGDRALMARTRMQAARQVHVSHRIANWRSPIDGHCARLDNLSPRLLCLQFGGAVGTLGELGDRAPNVTRALADELDLNLPTRPWHTDRSSIVEFAQLLAMIAGSLGKIGMDVALMAQDELGEIALAGTGGSSAMPHKRNPVLAEVLVAGARFAATLSGGMALAMVHEQERSGAAWTLEWMVMPQLCVVTGASLRNALDLLGKVESMGFGA